MKYVRDMENDLINLERMDYIYIHDKGEDYQPRFEVIAVCADDAYILKKCKSEGEANKYLKKIYESSKLDIEE